MMVSDRYIFKKNSKGFCEQLRCLLLGKDDTCQIGPMFVTETQLWNKLGYVPLHLKRLQLIKNSLLFRCSEAPLC